MKFGISGGEAVSVNLLDESSGLYWSTFVAKIIGVRAAQLEKGNLTLELSQHRDEHSITTDCWLQNLRRLAFESELRCTFPLPPCFSSTDRKRRRDNAVPFD